DAAADLHTEREAARLAGEQLAARDQLDTHHTQELNRARSQINALQLAVADGRYRLRIKAICPAMPGATGK
ncbi:Prophage PSPPH06, lysis protein, partial [Pseudomonas syringae pv. maculicola]